MEEKYVCTVFSAGGVLMEGAARGLQEAAIGLETCDAFVIDYYGMEFVAVITETGFEMDHYGVIYVCEPAL